MNENNSILQGVYPFWSKDVIQQYSDSCAIKAQQLILQSHGIDISEHELRDSAILNGWYTPGYGTPLEDVGNLLELYGIKINKYNNASLSDLVEELSHGHQVIVGVDSGELWYKDVAEEFEDAIIGEMADHALLISGLIIDPFTADSRVLLTDPGTGIVYSDYSVSEFEDAWNDSGNFYVTT